MIVADLPGFRAAQNRLREQLGVQVIFHVPIEATWGPEVALDPETQRPYDPFASPQAGSGGERDEPCRVGVIASLTTGSVPRDDVLPTPVGRMASDDMALDVDPADFERVAQATAVTIYGERYKVEQLRPDGVGDLVVRYLAYVVKR